MDTKYHAFLIATHAYPEIQEQTISMLEADNHYFFIHVDKKTKDCSPWQDIAKRHKNVILINDRLKMYWGGV